MARRFGEAYRQRTALAVGRQRELAWLEEVTKPASSPKPSNSRKPSKVRHYFVDPAVLAKRYSDVNPYSPWR